MDLTHDRLKELLDYDSETGIFKWKIRAARCIHIGDVAGSINEKGYRIIAIDKIDYKASRLVIFYITGEWPEEVHHKNHITDDDRLDNLQDVSHLDNAKDRVIRKDSTSKRKGVCWDKRGKVWATEIKANGIRYYLGRYKNLEEAAEVYRQAALKYHGEFAHF